jgi:hypothetical protein
MPVASRFALFWLGLAVLPAFSKGITVRFLPNPPEDSVVEYRILRADAPGQAPAEVGRLPAAAGRDTFSFADTSAVRGLAYRYSIVGMDAGGGASDPSESTEVALPSLSLPDTLRGDGGGARWALAVGADPLVGSAALALALEDSSRFSLHYDSAARQIVFAPRDGEGSGWAVVRATYYGKFADRDSVWLAFGAASVAPRAGDRASAIWSLPAAWSPGRGSLRLRAPSAHGGPGPGAATWSLITPRGRTVAVVALPGDGRESAWDGRDRDGRPMRPAAYLWAVRGSGGALLGSGTLRILP